MITFQGTHRYANCLWLSIFHKYVILLYNYAGSKQKSYKRRKMQMFAA